MKVAKQWWSVVVCCLLAPLAHAAKQIDLEVGQSRLIPLSQEMRSVYIVDSTIADAKTPSARSALVFGAKVGKTDLVIVGKEGEAIAHYRLNVKNSGLSQLERHLETLYPSHRIALQSVGDSIAVAGTVASPEMAADILSLVNNFAVGQVADKERLKEINADASRKSANPPEGPGGQSVLPLVINQLKITAAPQVNISIRMVEMAKSTSEELGIRWQSVNPNWMLGVSPGNQFATGIDLTDPDNLIKESAFMGIIDALASKSLVNVLAEPNLTAKSGEKAEFLVGGEFPFPSIDGESVGVEFKSFGVGLSVTPTVLSENRISLTVTPVVSALSRQNSIKINGVDVPGLDKRTATTTIELADGQSFALAGLLRTSEENSVDAIPFLGELPGVGALFRTNKNQQIERELVIIATASLVQPTGDIESIPTPLDHFRAPTRLERLLFGELEGHTDTPKLIGDYGYRY
ncbi:pilus assembly protein N-terminal domain-containing protein [Vibrio vulnificus]|nr:pilus assembly protein N-terminal domain-containing protein [Vibrio vulnificus]